MSLDWEALISDARGFLYLDDDEAVPVDELIEQAKAHGYTEREVKQALRETDELEHVGGLDDQKVKLAQAVGTGEKYLADSETADPLDEYEYNGYVREADTEAEEVARDAAVTFTASNSGPPFATHIDDAGDWWQPGYDAACVAVEEAIVDALLDDSVEPTNENSETPNSANPTGEGGGSSGSPDAEPGGKTVETHDRDVDKYRRVYLDAADRAGRNTWEYVEEEAVREALAAIGFEELLDNGTLFEVRPWRFVDVSDEEEDAKRRWYYPSGGEPRPDEFRRFDQLLRDSAPDEYEPHYFRVARASKNPATQYGGWKSDEARLSVDEAVEWMKNGGNIGIAGRPDDQLINVDIDDDEETTPEDVPSSLRARSRSRTGWHTWYFDENGEIPNIPTDDYGEVRADWQYVVAPGSFVASTEEGVAEDATEPGYYTVEDEDPVVSIEYDDLPEVFRDVAEEIDEADEADDDSTDDLDVDRFDPTDSDGETSAVFDVEAADLVSSRHDPSNRFTSIFHGSDTGANMSVSGDKLHCWRHGVAHGGLQALATLSDVEHVRNYGCQDLGAAHKHSGAGANKLKGDWRLVWGAWYEAKQRNAIPDDDPIPYNALINLAVDDGLVERDELVERDSDTGEVVEDEDTDTDTDTETYTAFPPGVYTDALDHVAEEYDVDPGRERPTYQPTDGEERDEYTTTARDLLDLEVVVEPRNALEAAAAVEPSDLTKELPELERDDVDDVAIAVALAEGMIDDPSQFPSDGGYTAAYYTARDRYGAPLPKYLDNETLEHREELVFAALDRVAPSHILENCRSDITVEDPAGVALAKLNPTWEDSESGERILAGYGSGFYCVEHEVSFSPIQLVALEHGIIDSESKYPRGGGFKRAYTLLREEYGAPIPKWRSTLLEHVAVLPPAQRVLNGGFDLPEQSRQDAHKATEALIRDAVDVRDRAQLITVVPGGGKTYSTAIVADDHPVLYLPPRNELKKQMEEYAEEITNDDEIDAEPTVKHLPIFAENRIPEDALNAGVAAVRESDRSLLRNREQLYQIVEPFMPDEDEDEDEDEELTNDEDDRVELDRATCPTAEGEYGDKWRVAVQVARELKIKPADIHRKDKRLFGEELPCKSDGECEYNQGWKEVREPPVADILIGAPQHANVDSATTHFDRDTDGEVVTTTRAVVTDEFPGEAYVDAYDGRYMDYATWLAEALVDIDNREDLLDAGLNTDTWVNCWLDGEGDEYGRVADLVQILQTGSDLSDAREAAEKLLESGVLSDVSEKAGINIGDVREAVLDAKDGDVDDADDILDTLTEPIVELQNEADRAYATGDGDAGLLYSAVDQLEDIAEPLTNAAAAAPNGKSLTEAAEDAVEVLRVGGDLAALLDDAIDALRGDEVPDEVLESAITALRGGREGCRELSSVALDGHAHPDAWALLAGAIADTDENATEVRTGAFAFDREADEGGTFKRLRKNDAVIAADKNHHGALVVDTPEFTDITGAKCPVLGLDATGRTELWRLAIGRDTEQRDIHETNAERRRFLRDSGLSVVQTTDRPLPYHGSPDGKNFGEDVELVKTVAEEYTGDAEHAVDEKGPAVISTQKVLNHLDSVLDDHAGETVNYENMKGSDALGEHQVAVILGSCHFGDAQPEKWALLAGEDAARGDAKGNSLDYGSEVANTYLRYMREDHTMQAILRAGRNDEDTVVFAHTSALREDLPVEDQGVVLSAHSKGTLAVAEAAAEIAPRTFTAADVVEAIDGDERQVGRRQVQNVLADLRESGYIRLAKESEPGEAYVYEFAEDAGLADVKLPTGDIGDGDTHEKTRIDELNTQNFVGSGSQEVEDGLTSPSTPTIPATEATTAAADGPPPS